MLARGRGRTLTVTSSGKTCLKVTSVSDRTTCMPADVLQDIYDSTSIDIAQQARTAEGRTSTSSTDHPVVR